MSRKNQTFPKYVKLKLDPENPPTDLWEKGARRCIKCGTNWPCYTIFNPSPCCNANSAGVADVSPDMGWREAVKRLLVARFERYYEQWNDDLTDEAILFESSIDDGFPISDEDLRAGLVEISRLIGEPHTTET